MLQILPPLAYLAAAGFILWVAVSRGPARARWHVGALVALGLGFAAFSVLTLWCDGVMTFWTNHSTNLAGNQVWFDLLIAVAVAFALIAPRARAVGMPLLPWGLAVMTTASIALLPMLARLLWLERNGPRR